MVIYKTVTIGLPEPVWRIAERLQKIVNAKLRDMGRKPLNVSGIATVIMLRSLLDQAADIQDEYEQVGLDQLAVRLTDIIGSDGVAVAGLPETTRRTDGADGGGPHRRARAPGFFA